MKGAGRILHIRCGDDIRDKLAEGGLAGDYLSFADPAWLGPPPAFNAWLAGRAALIAERTGMARQRVRAMLGEAYWRLARAPADYDHIVLWFEHDLYDQAALVRVLANFAQRKGLPRIDLISVDRFRGIARFIGLGQLDAAQLASLWRKRKRVTRRQLALGTRAWAALRALTPEPIEALLASGTSALPFLKPALRRHLQELPWTTDGLSLTERDALAALAKGPLTASQLFVDAQLKREPVPFMGDLFFWSVVRDLVEAPTPPVAVSAGTRRMAWPRRRLRLTPTGRALLGGKVDWQGLSPLPRWVGGIPAGPGAPAWRWDPMSRRVTRLEAV
jgi:hypothetical protein